MSFWKKVANKLKFWGKKVVSKFSKERLQEIFDSLIKFFGGIFGDVWGTYREGILNIVWEIATGIVKPKQGQSKERLFTELLKSLVDTNKDGKITWDDIPKSTINFIREFAYNIYYKALGKSDEERNEALGKMLGKD